MSGSLRGVDVWFNGEKFEVLTTKQIQTKNTHGTGCNLSAAITANLALGNDIRTSVQTAKEYVTNALTYSLNIGKGQGPVGHFFPLLTK